MQRGVLHEIPAGRELRRMDTIVLFMIMENEIWTEILVQMEIPLGNLRFANLRHFVVQDLVGLHHCQTWLFSLEKENKNPSFNI